MPTTYQLENDRRFICFLPPKDYLDSYYDKANPIYNQIYEIGLENKTLTKLRDELLPMLMNGQLTIA